MNKNIKVIIREQRPQFVDAIWIYRTDWKVSTANNGSEYYEEVFMLDNVEFRCYIDESMKNYNKWETFRETSVKGQEYTVRILYQQGVGVYKGNVIRLHGDGVPKATDTDIDPKDSLFNF